MNQTASAGVASVGAVSPEAASIEPIEQVRELLRARAAALGLCPESAPEQDVTAAIETLLDREVTIPSATEEECRRWYDVHPNEFMAAELVLARHILFAVTPRTPIEPLRRKAEETLLELRSCPERFDARARELSNCSSGAQGGALGQLMRGESVPEFERALFGGDATGVLPSLVNTRFGFHIVAVDRRVAGRRVPFEAVRGEVAARMSQQSWQRALTQYVRVLANQAQVRGLDGVHAANPLVQ